MSSKNQPLLTRNKAQFLMCLCFSWLVFFCQPLRGLPQPPTLPRPSVLLKPALMDHNTPLFEQRLGNPKAPVVLIVYSCPSCAQCAYLYTQVVMPLVERHAQRCHFILREYPINGAGMRAALVMWHDPLHVAPLKKCILSAQNQWMGEAFQNWERIEEALLDLVVQEKLDRLKAKEALKSQAAIDQLTRYRQRENERIAIDAVPSVFLVLQDFKAKKRRAHIISPERTTLEALEDMIKTQSYRPHTSKG